MSTQVATLSEDKLNAFNLHNFSTESKLLSSASTNITQSQHQDHKTNNNNQNQNQPIDSHRSEKSLTHTLKDVDSFTNDDEIERVNSMHEFVKMSSLYTANNETKHLIHTPSNNNSTSSKAESSRLSYTPPILQQQTISPESNEQDQSEDEEENDEYNEPKLTTTTSKHNDSETNNRNTNRLQDASPMLADVNFDDVDFKETPKDSIGKQKLFIRSLEYIQHLREPRQIVNDQKCYEAFFYVKHLLSNDERFVMNRNWKFLSKLRLSKVMVINTFILAKNMLICHFHYRNLIYKMLGTKGLVVEPVKVRAIINA